MKVNNQAELIQVKDYVKFVRIKGRG